MMANQNESKNLLQTYTQTHALPLPIYDVEASGPDHERLFRASCNIFDQTWVDSEYHKSKKDSEKSVAKIALSELQRTKSDRHANNDIFPHKPADEKNLMRGKFNADIIIIIDADNVDVPLDLLRENHASFIFFVAKNGTKIMTEYEKCGNAMIFTAPCVGKDATDICLTYYTRNIRDTFPQARIAILTRDHFAVTLAVLARASHVCHIKELNKWLVDNQSDKSI